ncbi:MAG: NAD(P)/FAD-dependent oxidoreductase [Clostridia bacterium]|nr:NAD(P)/FAD-dependent oxidoreductase [Clostridia bacterium]
MRRVLVIGGGPAGMMAACTAASAGAAVILLERNAFCGVKLNITGKGRCNLTNDCQNEELMRNIVTNGKFLYSAFSAMSSRDVMAYFSALGVPLKTERGNRVFPESDRAKDISGALRTQMHRLGVTVLQGKAVELTMAEGRVAEAVLQDGRRLRADAYILAAGGRSYPKTGSDGSGYLLAQSVGHTVTRIKPSLVPLLAEGDLPARLEGLSLRNVTFTVKKDGKTIFSEFGEMLFTDKGVSGPLVLSASAHLSCGKHSFPYQAEIDLKPALDADTLDKRILRDFSQTRNRDFSNALSGLLPTKLIPAAVELSGITGAQKVNGITKKQREGFCRLLKAFPLILTGFGSWDEAIVTSGGISVKEVDPKTMRSKKVGNLYLAGEILDVDAYTGGFNLQIAWSTGFCAGQAAAKGEQES